MRLATSLLALLLAIPCSHAEDDFSDRCDAPYPSTYCNTTSILAYESYSCSPYHIFVARGSDEPYPGRLGNITSQICARFPSGQCTFENIEYPAKSTAWGKQEWCKSAAKGAKAGQAQLRGYAGKCPQSKLIVLGFSQGASVVQDALGGGGGKVFECEQESNEALDRESAPGANVVAAVTFGAVIRAKNQNFTMGDTKSFEGKRGRTAAQVAGLNKYAGVLRDYCHFGDPMCAVGSEPADVWVHLDYFLGHNEEVVPWVVGKAKSAEVKAVSASSTKTGSAAQTAISSSAILLSLALFGAWLP